MIRSIRRARRLAAVALAAAAVFALAAAPAAAEDSRSFEKTFTLGDGATLRLANLAGKIELANGAGDQVRVRATVHAEGADAAETRALLDAVTWTRTRDEKGAEVWAVVYPVDRYRRFHYPSRERGAMWEGWGSHSSTTYLGKKVTVDSRKGDAPTLYVDLEIVFPDRGELDLRNAVGAVRGGDLAGRLGIDTGSGDVEVGAGRMESVVVDTGSGDVRVAGLDAETFDLDTGSGDVTLRSPLLATRTVRVDTGSGEVEIRASAQASFKLTADQGSGDLEVGYSDARVIREGRKAVGAERGDGRTRIEIDTGSGDCTIAPG
jgi:hypothetical protein